LVGIRGVGKLRENYCVLCAEIRGVGVKTSHAAISAGQCFLAYRGTPLIFFGNFDPQKP
jgi:hypothetical protein